MTVLFTGLSVQAGTDPLLPVIGSNPDGANALHLTASELNSSGAYDIETSDRIDGSWTSVYAFAGIDGATNWTADVDGSTTSAFYRIRRTPYHAKVGETAQLITRFHNVGGTCVIADNDTITITNFTFDGTGIDVRAVVSPNSSFSPYTIISGDLRRGTPYNGETLSFDLPMPLDDVNYISIWCVPATVSFGDGQFF